MNAQRQTRTAHKLITCIMPAGRGLELIEQLRELGVTSAQVHHEIGRAHV